MRSSSGWSFMGLPGLAGREVSSLVMDFERSLIGKGYVLCEE